MARILVLDDDPDLREMVAIRLNRAGHQVTELGGGSAVLCGVLPVSFDLVLTDIYMPEGEGIETLLYIRRNYPGVPVLVMSGAGTDPKDGGFLEVTRLLGAAAVLPKPFEAEDLLRAVDDALQLETA